jgi:DNA-binding transcriptional ArsR family regulator
MTLMTEQRVFEVDDIAVFDTLNNPLRIRILRHLEVPRSVRALAELLGVPTTRLYYHVNLLVESGIVECVDTRKVGAMIERIYRRTADSFKPSPRLIEQGHDPEDLARVGVSVVLDLTRVDAEAALKRHFEAQLAGEAGNEEITVGRSLLSLTPEGVRAIEEKLDELMTLIERVDQSQGGAEYTLTFVFVPVVDVE